MTPSHIGNHWRFSLMLLLLDNECLKFYLKSCAGCWSPCCSFRTLTPYCFTQTHFAYYVFLLIMCYRHNSLMVSLLQCLKSKVKFFPTDNRMTSFSDKRHLIFTSGVKKFSHHRSWGFRNITKGTYMQWNITHTSGKYQEWNWVICREVDGPRVCHTEWSKPERVKQI